MSLTLAKGSDKGSIEVILNITWLFVLQINWINNKLGIYIDTANWRIQFLTLSRKYYDSTKMGERKVLNVSHTNDMDKKWTLILFSSFYFLFQKYYPPDFETFKLPKLRRTNQQYVVWLMIPFTMRCLTCGNHMYKGKKFNARKEIVEEEKYLGMPIFWFYIRCPACLSEIAFKVFISLVMTVINYSLSLSLFLSLSDRSWKHWLCCWGWSL